MCIRDRRGWDLAPNSKTSGAGCCGVKGPDPQPLSIRTHSIQFRGDFTQNWPVVNEMRLTRPGGFRRMTAPRSKALRSITIVTRGRITRCQLFWAGGQWANSRIRLRTCGDAFEATMYSD